MTRGKRFFSLYVWERRNNKPLGMVSLHAGKITGHWQRRCSQCLSLRLSFYPLPSIQRCRPGAILKVILKVITVFWTSFQVSRLFSKCSNNMYWVKRKINFNRPSRTLFIQVILMKLNSITLKNRKYEIPNYDFLPHTSMSKIKLLITCTVMCIPIQF